MVKINGELVDAVGMTVAQYLEKHQYDRKKVAVEINENIVSKEAYDTVMFQKDDVVEVVSFVGGG